MRNCQKPVDVDMLNEKSSAAMISNMDIKKIISDVEHLTRKAYLNKFSQLAVEGLGLISCQVLEVVQDNRGLGFSMITRHDLPATDIDLMKIDKNTIVDLQQNGYIVNNLCLSDAAIGVAQDRAAEYLVSLLGIPGDGDRLIGLIAFVSESEIIGDDLLGFYGIFSPRIVAELECVVLGNQLNKSRNDFRYLVETSRDMIWELDLNGRFVCVNRPSIMIYGYYPDEMKGMHFSRLMSTESAKEYDSYLGRSVQGNGVYDIVANHINKHGRPIQIIYNAKPKYSITGELVGYTGTTTDITESVRAQVAIRNNSELFSAILARLPVIFFRVDENGCIVDIRGQGLKRMGVDDMAWVGRPGYGLFVGMDEMIDSALSGKTVHFKSSGSFEGKTWWFYTSMFFDSWTGFGAVGFAVDITDQMESEEKLVHLLKDNRVLAQRLVEIQEEERRNLSRELHDELGQSITAVKSLATAITAAAGDSYSEIRSLGNSIIDLSGRLYEVVNRIMRRLRPDILDSLGFEETINSCLTNSQLERTGVNCKLQIKGNIEDLDEVVQITVYRIVQECLTNISKYAMASNIDVRIERRPGAAPEEPQGADLLIISVVDDGVGMDFGRDATSRVAEPKMGLQGIKERVTALGGDLDIESAPGKGVKIRAVIGLDGRPGAKKADPAPESKLRSISGPASR